MFGFDKPSQEFIEYTRSQNVSNIKLFALTLSGICILVIFGNPGRVENFAYDHILNYTNIGIAYSIIYFGIWLVLKYSVNRPIIQDITIWFCIIAAFLFTSLICYIDILRGGGTMVFALGCLLIAVVLSTRLITMITLFLINGGTLYAACYYLSDANMNEYRIGIVSIVILSVIVFITVEANRRKVFLTQRKLADKITELNNALDVKSVFFGHMSHELRTPLNAIIGFSEMIMKDNYFPKTEEKLKEYVGFINSGGNHLLSLVDDILDQSKIESGEVKINSEKVDLCKLLRSYVDELSPASITKNQTVKFKSTHNDIMMNVDQRLLKQIMYNLISNAQKYTPSGGIIDVSADLMEDDHVTIAIKDNGKGISQDLIKSLLHNTVPLKTHFISHAEGTGLGLIIVKQLVNLLEGEMFIRSKTKQGTEVKIVLPQEFEK